MQKLRFLRRKLARVNPKDTIEEALFGQGCIQERNAHQRKDPSGYGVCD
jgi:hypothetical protein